jgi:serine/threonine protein kinase
MISQVCSGMTSVASAGLVHRDLALRNILAVKFEPAQGLVHVKVSDFGISKEGTCYYGGGTAIPVRWTAPEALMNRKKFTEKSDVWSFGVLIWELLDGQQRMPYWEQQDDLLLTSEIGKGTRQLECPDGADPVIWQFALEFCLVRVAAARPQFADLMIKLREVGTKAQLEKLEQARRDVEEEVRRAKREAEVIIQEAMEKATLVDKAEQARRDAQAEVQRAKELAENIIQDAMEKASLLEKEALAKVCYLYVDILHSVSSACVLACSSLGGEG